MKICNCKTHTGQNPLPLENFSKNKNTQDGPMSRCKECVRLSDQKFYAGHKDEIIGRVSDWQKGNKEKVNQSSQKYRADSKEKRAAVTKRYRDSNKGLITFHANKRRKVIKQATPSWADVELIKLLYIKAAELTEATGISHHIHHIIPLSSDENVCGLHCENNLMIVNENDHRSIHRNYTMPNIA